MEELSPEGACERLREWREGNVRDSMSIVELGERLVRKYSHRFGDEMWLICEQIFLASLDVRRFDLANLCMEMLVNNFPKSGRVRKLKAMQLEANGKYTEAEEVYDQIIDEDPTNAAARKRKVAILKAQGLLNDAIKCLTEYLKIFMADHEAWMELAEMYIEGLDYSKAAFCMEELILTKPFNHLYYQRYAEIKYTQGGVENLESARRYFAQAVKLSNNSSTRALYGLYLCASQLAHTKGASEGKDNRQYANWAVRMISRKYKTSTDCEPIERTGIVTEKPVIELPQLANSVTEMLDKLQLNSNK